MSWLTRGFDKRCRNLDEQVAKAAPDAGTPTHSIMTSYEHGALGLVGLAVYVVSLPFFLFGAWLIALPLLACATGLWALARPCGVALTSSRLVIMRWWPFRRRPSHLVADLDRHAITARARSIGPITIVTFENAGPTRRILVPYRSMYAYSLVSENRRHP